MRGGRASPTQCRAGIRSPAGLISLTNKCRLSLHCLLGQVLIALEGRELDCHALVLSSHLSALPIQHANLKFARRLPTNEWLPQAPKLSRNIVASRLTRLELYPTTSPLTSLRLWRYLFCEKL